MKNILKKIYHLCKSLTFKYLFRKVVGNSNWDGDGNIAS